MRYFVGFLVTIGLIIVLILMLFGGGNDKSKLPQSAKTLESYASSNAEARLIIEGPVNADSNHTRIQINVSKDQVTYSQMKGYEGNVVKSTSYANNVAAYSYFLKALAGQGFTKGNLDPLLKDERGYCPLGSRYVVEFVQGNKQIERFWYTSCGSTRTYEGKSDVTTQLFESQVPDFTEVNHDSKLS